MARLADSLTVAPGPGAVRNAEASAERAAAYRAHPFLDPLFPSRQRAAARFWVGAYRSLVRDGASFSRALGSALASRRQLLTSSPVSYFEDADKFIDDLLRAAPEPLNRRLALLPETRAANELDALLRLALRGVDPRPRYEAQRKLYLAKLLFDIDHCRSVRDGPKHRAIFEGLLQQALWSEMQSDQEIEVCCELDSEGLGERLKIVAASTRAECWRFRVRRLEARKPAIDVYHFRSRFKRETDPVAEVSSGALSLREEPRWPTLGRRSGSILSKMIRRGIGDPHMIQDLIGAMFIVATRRQVYALERRLVDALGGPLRWRDRVDTISCQADRERLDAHSSPGFEVLKQIVDILVEDPTGAAPYLFPVEVQIYPLEAYLRTLHSSHYANHSAYKRRQLLHDLLPVLFPVEIYGENDTDQP